MTAAQLSFEDLPLVRSTDPDTSRAAAAAQTPARLSTGRLLALVALGTHGPLTDFELADHTGRAQTSIGCRRKDLARVGLVEATGDTRPSPTGSPSKVWRLTDAGRREWERQVAS